MTSTKSTSSVDVPNSSAALAVQEVTREKKRIFLMSEPELTDLTGKACSPYGFHWTYDNYAMAGGTARALVEQGYKTWFLITADYAFGHLLEAETTKMVTALGGRVLGSARHSFGTADFSSTCCRRRRRARRSWRSPTPARTHRTR